MISWQYLAGLLDGEGSIGTTKTGRRRNVIGRVQIANTDTVLLELLRAEFGGSISVRKTGAKPGWKPFASIAWTNRGAQRVLEGTLPYLLVKRSQAELCLRLIKMRDDPKSERYDYFRTQGGHCRIKDSVANVQDAIVVQLKQLNRKGVAA